MRGMEFNLAYGIYFGKSRGIYFGKSRFVHIFFWILKEDTVRWVSARKSDTLKR